MRYLTRVGIFFLGAFLPAGPQLAAQTHIVSAEELRQAVVSVSQQGEHNRETLRQVLSTPEAEKIIRAKGMDPQQIRQAVSLLSDEELNQLAGRAEQAQKDFAAGGGGAAVAIILLVVGFVIVFIILHSATTALKHL